MGRMKNVYGCVKCQIYHLEDEPIYKEHIYYQSKHGIQQWSEAVWAKAMLKRRTT